jgi:hypothetical protein
MTRGVLLLALLTFTQLLLAQEKKPAAADKVSALSRCGRYQLVLKRSSQEPSRRGDNGAAVSLYFAMEFQHAGHQGFFGWRPEGVYLEGGNPFVSGRIDPVTYLPKNKNSGWTSNSFGYSEVTVSDLEVGQPRETLDSLTINVTLIHVKSWDIVTFADLEQRKSDYLHCGPFQLVVTGEETKVNVCVAAISDFWAEKKEYERRVPLRFLNHVYGLQQTVIHDAKDRVLSNEVHFVTGGASAGPFVIPSAPGVVKPPSEPIAYPVRVEVKLPNEYDTEQVFFDFTDIPLPVLKTKS